MIAIECFVSVLVLSLTPRLSVSEVAVKGFCGDPGKPVRSSLTPIQTRYIEDETVVYTCDEFISLRQYRKCSKGKWRGESAVCGKGFKDNDIIWAKIYDNINDTLIQEYNTSHLIPFTKFANSFIAERLEQPLRAFGSKSYRFELTLHHKAVFHLVRFSLLKVNNLVDDKIRRSKLNITRVTAGPYRVCRPIRQSNVSPWLQNSTRFDYWFNCESTDAESYKKELKNKTNLITIESESNNVLTLDLSTLILTEQYIDDDNPHKPQCGVPDVPIGLSMHVINPNTKYAFRCGQGFKNIDGEDLTVPRKSFSLSCVTDMKWSGSLPQCLPEKTCKKFELSQRHLTEVFQYERVYYYNDSQWFAIEGTRAHFRCKDETMIFIGKEVRVCNKDGQWSDSLPNCLGTDSESKLNVIWISIIIIFTLILTFGLSALLVYWVLRMKKTRSETMKQNVVRNLNIHDDYDLQNIKDKNLYEYENYYTDEKEPQIRQKDHKYIAIL